MKTFTKLLILVFVVTAACSEDEQHENYSTEILQDYDWELVSASTDGRIVAVIGQPFPTLNIEYDVIRFLGVSGGAYFDVLEEAQMLLGNWEVNDKNLTLNGDLVKIKSLTQKELIYVTEDDYVIKRKAIAK